ncbi:hypothetical protein Tco_1001324 [Tanacetum coccineum]
MAFALYWCNLFVGLLQLASVVGFVLSFQWFHGLFMVWKILPVHADGMNVESLCYGSQFPGDDKTCRQIVLGCLTMRLRLFGLRFGKIVGGAIGACGGIGKRASEAKRSLVKSFEKLGYVFPGKAGK